MSVAILNAITLAGGQDNPSVKIPSRKELTKLLKNANFDNFCKVFDELNHVRIRKVPCIEATGTVGIVNINHPIIGQIPCLAYRDKTISEYEYKLVNSGLGQDEVTIHVTNFYEKLNVEGKSCYAIFLDTGEKVTIEHPEYSCNECSLYAIEDGEDYCLYDKEKLQGIKCCNKYLDCFKWHTTEDKEK